MSVGIGRQNTIIMFWKWKKRIFLLFRIEATAKRSKKSLFLLKSWKRKRNESRFATFIIETKFFDHSQQSQLLYNGAVLSYVLSSAVLRIRDIFCSDPDPQIRTSD